MSCLFACFRAAPFRRGDSTLRSRRVLVRTSDEKESFSYRQTSTEDAAWADEKIALSERDQLLDDFDEDAEERSTYISEKQLEAGTGDSLHVEQDVEMMHTKKLVRKSVGFRLRKKPEKGFMTPLKPHNTGDELHRRAEFERHVKKMDRADAQRAWATENKRREQWKNDRRNARQQ